MALLATVAHVERLAMVARTRPRATAAVAARALRAVAVVVRALRAAAVTPRVEAAGIPLAAVVADTPAVAVATPVEAIAKRSNKWM